MNQRILSRHRLPRVYRLGLTGFWLAPVVLFLSTFIIGGLHQRGFDLRLLLPLALMALPAVYVWHEGVDVLPDGLRIRIHWPRFYSFDTLDTWYVDTHPNRRRLSIWNQHHYKVLECHTAHLSDVSTLLRVLQTHIRYRGWPE